MAQQPKRSLTDTYIRTRKPAAAGERDITPDETARGLALSVTDHGHKSFVMIARYPPSKNPTKRALGDYPTLTLEAAREKATAWRSLIKRGVDPKEEELRSLADEARRRALEANKRENTFAAAAEIYIQRNLKKQRRGKDSEREIRKELISRWGERPLDEIRRADVIAMVDEIVDRGASEVARHALGHAKTMFKSFVGRELLEHSPAVLVEAKDLIGPKRPRQRVLTDEELFAVWRASGRLGYPYGPLFRLLMLTATRKNEVAGARWREIDLETQLWTIPPERFKSDSTHLVPLTDEAVSILKTLPRWNNGEAAFSNTFGRVAVAHFSKAKTRLDRQMLRTLRAVARRQGKDPSKVQFDPFVIHDIRRTVRTRLSSLRIRDEVAEMVIGHGRKGIQRVYDQHKYVDEMREALQSWASMLKSICEPAPTNVVQLKRA